MNVSATPANPPATTADAQEQAFLIATKALEKEITEAKAKLQAMIDAAIEADPGNKNAPLYSLHEVSGVGRYAIERYSGWRATLGVIRDPKANIDFSIKEYPGFDALIGKHFNSPYLLDPLNDHYESYASLRENIAAVRNTLMQHYYANTPPGMTPADAERALQEIATYIGQGLANNYAYLGVLPNYDPFKPHIDLGRALRPNGEGAQYLYECVLRHKRTTSDWYRPFWAVTALFGGKKQADWHLLPADKTGFTTIVSDDLADFIAAKGPKPEEIEAQIAAVSALEAKLAGLVSGAKGQPAAPSAGDRAHVVRQAGDLERLAQMLMTQVAQMQGVERLSEPVRQDAVEIAREILRKLKVSAVGSVNVMAGLRFKPSENLQAMGEIAGVAQVYQQMVAYARGVDPRVLSNPAVVAGAQAIGQLGYLAMRESRRLYALAGAQEDVARLDSAMKSVPAAYSAAWSRTVGELLGKIEQGIQAVLEQTKTLTAPGLAIAHEPGNELGQGLAAAPTAGKANQQGAHTKVQQQAEAASQLQALAQHNSQARDHSEQAARALQSGQAATSSSRSGGLTRTPPRPSGERTSAVPVAVVSHSPVRAGIPPNAQSTANARQAAEQARLERRARRIAEMNAQEQLQRAQRATRRAAKADARAQRNARQSAVAQAHHDHAHHDSGHHPAAHSAPGPAGVHLDPKLLEDIRSATNTMGLPGAPISPGDHRDHLRRAQRSNGANAEPFGGSVAAPGSTPPAAGSDPNDPKKYVPPHYPAPAGPTRGGRGY